jgi:threonine dehydrogenase-like Zn-dependent dehydrogenase
VIDADIHVGETVAVFGQGVPGLLAGQLARINGADVVAVDGIARRLELAAKLGAWRTVDFNVTSPAETIKALTRGRGADVCIELSGAASALSEAIRAAAYNSRVVAAGFVQGAADHLFLGEEFHHNRVQVVSSQISGVNPWLSQRWNQLRLAQTFIRLCAERRVETRALVSHVVSAERADEAFRLLHEEQADCLQVVLDFSGTEV